MASIAGCTRIGPDPGLHPAEDALRLAQAVGEQHAGHPSAALAFATSLDLAQDIGLGRHW